MSSGGTGTVASRAKSGSRGPLTRFVTLGALLLASLAPVALASGGPAFATGPCEIDPQLYDAGGVPGLRYPSDPLFPRQWGLEQIRAPDAWSRGVRGAGAVIALVDEGIDLNHPDLVDRLIPGRDFFEGANGDCPGPQDQTGHGTRVAGVAAASANNGIGVTGTAPQARLMPLKVVSASFTNEPTQIPERFAEALVAAIYHAANEGADVINISIAVPNVVWDAAFGPGTTGSLREAVDYAWAHGSVVVGAAGNNSLPMCLEPAANPQVICVGATDKYGEPALYSNFPVQDPGTETGVAVRAPGGLADECEGEPPADDGVWTTSWPLGEARECAGPTPLDPAVRGAIDGYSSVAGTSFATGFVSGVAALLAGKGLSNYQVRDCLKFTSTNKGRYDPVMGYGVVDAGAAVSTCVREVGAP